MLEGQFSRTAISAAGHRAAHQVLDGAKVFIDPLAARILGEDLEGRLADARDPQRRPLRLFIALRSRIAEDTALAAISEGARQVVVLGAGLDTLVIGSRRSIACACSKSIIPRPKPKSAEGWRGPKFACLPT